MRRGLIVLFVGIMLCITACTSLEDDLVGVWFYNPEEAEEKKGIDTLLTSASFLSLHKDGSYTRDLGRYDYGQWVLEGDELVLTNAQEKLIRIRIKKQQGKELQLHANENVVVPFLKYTAPSAKDDPFALANNQWRIRATQSETDKQIQARLYNHCQFWETYFKWGLDNDINAIDVAGTPTPLKIYANGFGLKKFEELPTTWQRYFYDTTDCRKADRLIKDIFRKRNIKWPKTDVTYEKFISAFQQLQQQLK